jgi:hypothetical protein
MEWRLKKVRVANIPSALRAELERTGEIVIANALAVPMDVPSSPFHNFRFEDREAAEAWLTERRDIKERKEQAAARVQWAILFFAILGVLVTVALH